MMTNRDKSHSNHNNSLKSEVKDGHSASLPHEGITKPSKWDPDILQAKPEFQLQVADETPSIRVTRPHKHWWVRATVDPELRLDVYLLDYRGAEGASGGDGLYFVRPVLVKALEAEIGVYTMVPSVTKEGTPFLWPLRVPKDDAGRTWHLSARDIAEAATHHWLRVLSNRQASMYYARVDQEDQTPPRFPNWDLPTWLEKAFKDREIDSLDHPVAANLLRGREV